MLQRAIDAYEQAKRSQISSTSVFAAAERIARGNDLCEAAIIMPVVEGGCNTA